MKKILIIEDDVFLGDVLLRKLKNNGYETSLARDGAEGLRVIRQIMPDLILLDIVLPAMNGYEVLEEKIKDESIAHIPVIVISNSGQPVEIDHILSLGVADYLIKAQFDPEEVLHKVRLQLKDSSSEKKIEKKAKAPEASSLKDKKIMWVEDDVFLSEIIGRKLATQGCKLFHEIDGESALLTIAKEKPEIVLLDILLSGIDGFEILKRIKANPETKHIPVILLSNLGQQEDINKGKVLGAERFLIKATVTLDEIIDEIKKILDKKKTA